MADLGRYGLVGTGVLAGLVVAVFWFYTVVMLARGATISDDRATRLWVAFVNVTGVLLAVAMAVYVGRQVLG